MVDLVTKSVTNITPLLIAAKHSIVYLDHPVHVGIREDAAHLSAQGHSVHNRPVRGPVLQQLRGLQTREQQQQRQRCGLRRRT